MAAAYAALLSLFHTLNHIKNHPSPPISLDQTQVHSLTQNITFLLHFLERCSGEEDDDLESRITASAYAAEDVIETHIVNQIHAQGVGRVMDLMKKKSDGSTSDAALLSLFYTLNHIKSHPRPPISVDESQVESLTFLKDLLERYPSSDSQQDDDLKTRITAAAYAAGHVIESYIVDQIHAGSTSHDINTLPIDLEGLIGDMDLIKTEVMMRPQHHPHLHINSSSVSTASTWQKSTTPVFDDAIIIQLLDKLVGQQSSLQIVPIVGMGGIGKTTLATHIFRNPLIVEHFDTLTWVTISQEYTRRNILQLLCQDVKVSKKVSSEMSEDEIGLVLYKHLCGRRYLIVMDDMWSVEAWYKIRSYFPNENRGSRIMITTRLSNLAFELNGCHGFQMPFLDEDKSWDLLCEIVFGKLDCPTELENVGKEIAIKCKGLPLSIDVIGGLLRKSNMTQTYWMYTLDNLSFIINMENNEYSLRILRTSYKELPMHLKPCFLYMGIFPEDKVIKTSLLIRFWVAEGILKPIEDKSLEEVAKEYLKELIDRNLILVSKLRWNGEAKMCRIHDLLRDICLREAQKQKFFCVLRQQRDHIPQEINMERRICINPENAVEKYSPEFLHSVESASLTRSLLYTMHADSNMDRAPSPRFRLLRVYSSVGTHDSFATDYNYVIFEQANLRYLSLYFNSQVAVTRMLSFCSLLWNLQTLKIFHPYPLKLTFDIWKMPVLRHVVLNGLALPDPPNGEDKDKFVLENLETLSGIINLKFSEEVIKRIPNVKKLVLAYESSFLNEELELPDLCLNNLGRLQNLESLFIYAFFLCGVNKENMRRSLVSFPHSLKKLTLHATELNWEDVTISIGSLPLLQVLGLHMDACRGHKWETVEANFCSLKLLHIQGCSDLKYWDTDSTHFPRLEHLRLGFLEELGDIPSSIGDIPTLKSIQLDYCNKYLEDSAKRIKEEQEENGNEDLRVEINSYPPSYFLWDEEDDKTIIEFASAIEEICVD